MRGNRALATVALGATVSVAQPNDPECPADLNTDRFVDFFDVLEFVSIVESNAGPCGPATTLQAGAFDPIVAARNFATLQALLASGGDILIPSGVFHIQTPRSGEGLRITQDGTSLIGTGNTTLIFSREVRNGPFGGLSSDGVSNIEMRGIRFQGVRDVGDADTTKWGRGPDLRGGRNIVIEDCEFAHFLPHNLCIGRSQSPGGNWIVDGNPNSQSSVDALRATLAKDVVVRNCLFEFPRQSGLCIFGVDGAIISENDFRFPTTPNVRPLDNCDVIGVIQGGGTAILVDDASQQTPLEFYAFNDNIDIIANNAFSGLCDLTGVASANIRNNQFLAIRIDSYDFDQQDDNLSAPFVPLEFVDRDVQVVANFIDALCITSKWNDGVGVAAANYRTQGTSVVETLAIVRPNCSGIFPVSGAQFCDRD